MATSSIMRNFLVSGKRQVEKFSNAIDESAQSARLPINVKVTQIESLDELNEFLRDKDGNTENGQIKKSARFQ